MKRLLLILFLFFGIANAQTHTYKFILSSGPGSGSDVVVDTYTSCLERQKINVLKEFKPGANGLIAINTLQQAKDTDKVTNLLVGNFGLNMLGNFPNIDLLEDINPTVYMNQITMVFVGRTGKTDTMDELRTLSKIRPINAGSSTVLGNFMIETMFTELSIPYQVIPYKNNVNMLTDTVNGSLDILLDTYIGAKPMLETGKVKIIASTFDKRTANKYNHESIQSFSKKLGKMPLGILLSVNPSVSKEARTMLVNSIYECNKDSDVLNKLESMSSGPMFYTTEEIRNIVKSVAKK
jgi:tripartite-type tricarboxylate transporter receptor subunit TctC